MVSILGGFLALVRVVEVEKDVSWFTFLILGNTPIPSQPLTIALNIVIFCFCRSALDYCKEAAAILEKLADTVTNTDANKNHLSLVQDRLSAAYLWQALLDHKTTMEDKPEVESPEGLSESYDTGEVLVQKMFFFSS